MLFYRNTSLLSSDISHSKFHFHFKTTVMEMTRRTFSKAKDDEKKPLIVTVSTWKKGYKETIEVGLVKLKQSNFVKLLRYKKHS